MMYEEKIIAEETQMRLQIRAAYCFLRFEINNELLEEE